VARPPFEVITPRTLATSSRSAAIGPGKPRGPDQDSGWGAV